MAQPISKEFHCNPKDPMKGLQKAAGDIDLTPLGKRPDLGLASFRTKNNKMLYAHIVEQTNSGTKITLAPGLPYLADCDQSNIPESTIHKLLKKVDHILN